jgi:ribosomal protein S16
MTTKAETRDRAANDLGLLRLGQSLQSQDSTRITDAYEEVYAQLKEEGVATWVSTGAVPDHMAQHVASLVAENCLNTYSVSQERYARILNAANNARAEIKKYTTPFYESLDESTDY